MQTPVMATIFRALLGLLWFGLVAAVVLSLVSAAANGRPQLGQDEVSSLA